MGDRERKVVVYLNLWVYKSGGEEEGVAFAFCFASCIGWLVP